jgi:hypothetical protein
VTETQIQKQILDFLEAHPAVLYSFRCNSGTAKAKGFRVRMAPAGTPDIIGWMKSGKALAVEVKTVKDWSTKNHGASDKQINNVSGLYESGGVAGIVCSVDQARLVLAGDRIGF